MATVPSPTFSNPVTSVPGSTTLGPLTAVLPGSAGSSNATMSPTGQVTPALFSSPPLNSPLVASSVPATVVAPMPAPTPVAAVVNSPLPSPVVTPPLQPTKPATTLLEVLVQQGYLTQEQANQASLAQMSANTSMEAVLQKNYNLSEDVLTKAQATLQGIPYINIADTSTSPEALAQIQVGMARNYGVLPFACDKEARTLSVAMKNPLDLTVIDFIQQKTGMKLIAYYASPSELDRVMNERYTQSLSSDVSAALEQTAQVAADRTRKQDLSALSAEPTRQAPITKIVETIVSFALKARASDIHIEPQEDKTRVRYRIDGLLAEKLTLPSSVHDAVVSRIKILSELKIDEKRIPQDGRFTFTAPEGSVDLRISTLPTINGEKIVMRLLKKDASIPSLSELGLSGLALRQVEDAIKVPHGIVLVTGPTGSGKTTTLYSVLHTINSPRVNIMTLEDPVEYQMPGINQVQINQQAGLTFASGLRSFLRQDPNIIMVGEIRDSETAELAVQASLTGHLVFSTLHTSSAAGAIPRLVDMGAEPFLLASSMTLAMAQRVVRKLDPTVCEDYQPDKAILADIRAVLGDKFDVWCKQQSITPEQIKLKRPKAELSTDEQAYKGRMAIFEVMKITDKLGKLILDRAPATELERVALADGMYLMKQDGYLKALAGLTTIEEVLRVAQI